MSKDPRGSQQHSHSTYVGDQPVTVYRLLDTMKVFRDKNIVIAPWQSRSKYRDINIQVATETQQQMGIEHPRTEPEIPPNLSTASGRPVEDIFDEVEEAVDGGDAVTDVWVIDRHMSSKESHQLSTQLASQDNAHLVVATERFSETLEHLQRMHPHVRTHILK